MAWYVEGIHRIEGGHLVRPGAFVPGLGVRNEAATLWIGHHTTVQGGIRHAGGVVLGKGSVTWKPVHAGHELVVGAECKIPGDASAKGRIVVQAGAEIEGSLRAGGDVYLFGNCTVGDVDAGGDIVIVGAPKTGELRPSGRVRTRPW